MKRNKNRNNVRVLFVDWPPIEIVANEYFSKQVQDAKHTLGGKKQLTLIKNWNEKSYFRSSIAKLNQAEKCQNCLALASPLITVPISRHVIQHSATL